MKPRLRNGAEKTEHCKSFLDSPVKSVHNNLDMIRQPLKTVCYIPRGGTVTSGRPSPYVPAPETYIHDLTSPSLTDSTQRLVKKNRLGEDPSRSKTARRAFVYSRSAADSIPQYHRGGALWVSPAESGGNVC